MQASDSTKFQQKTPTKTSTLLSKRQQFKQQIRKSYLKDLFSSKRKQLLHTQFTKDQKEFCKKQKQSFLQNIQDLIQEFKRASSREIGESIIQKIFQLLSMQNVDVKSAMKQYGNQFSRMFVLFPQSRHSVQLLYQMLSFSYEGTFELDDQKFNSIFNQNCFQVTIQRKQLTQYQEAIQKLFQTIDNEIPTLGTRWNVKQAKSFEEQKVIFQHNKRIQKRVKLYLACLKELTLKINSFALRYEYVHKYLLKWAYQILIQYEFGQSNFLFYLFGVCKFIVPFNYLISLNEFQNTFNSGQIQSQKKLQKEVILKLFQLCVPTQYEINLDKVPYLSMLVVKTIFSYQQIKISQLIVYLEPILRLVKIVLNYQRYYKHKTVINVFELLASIIYRFNQEMTNINSSSQTRNTLKLINIVKLLTKMQFLSTFDLYFKVQNHLTCEPLFQILSLLIEYCIIFDHNLGELLYQKSLFPQICHKIDVKNYKILKANLKSIELICLYASHHKKKQFFAKMVSYGVDQRLQHLVFHIDEWISQRALNLKESYFTENQVDDYINSQCQIQKQGQIEDIQIPARHDVYEF